MLYGCCVNMLPDIGTLSGARYFEPLKTLGYDYVELPLKTLLALAPAELAKTQYLLHESGLTCRVCNDFIPSDYRIAGSEPTSKIVLRNYFRRAFDLIGQGGMGVPMAVYGSPWSKRCPDGFDRDTAWQQLKDFLADTAEIASAYGVGICVEFNNRTETNMITQLSDSVRIVREIGHPNLSVHCDYYHIRMEDDDPSALSDGGDLIRHVHIAELDRAYLTEADRQNPKLLDFAKALRAHAGHNETISMEARPRTEESWYAEAMTTHAVLHELFD